MEKVKFGLDYGDFFALIFMCIRDGKLADAAFICKGNIVSIKSFKNTSEVLAFVNENNANCMVFKRIGDLCWKQKTLISNMAGFRLNEKSITINVESIITPDMHRIPQQSRRIRF